jgi:hypothetical protein
LLLLNQQLFIFALALFALLVGDTAGCFTCRLARGLAFAAAAVFQALLKVTRLNCYNSFHNVHTPRLLIFKIIYHNIPVLSMKNGFVRWLCYRAKKATLPDDRVQNEDSNINYASAIIKAWMCFVKCKCWQFPCKV